MTIVLMAVVMLLGCGGRTPIEPDPTGGAGGALPGATASSSTSSGSGGGPATSYGTRLGPYYRSYADGTKVLDASRLWDAERQEPCSFVRVEGAKSRCLPAFVWDSKPGLFADAACSQRVAIVDVCPELPRYVRDQLAKPYETCAPAKLEALVPLGEPLPVGVTLYAETTSGCAMSTVTDAKNAALPMGPPVSLDAFVAGEEGP